MFIYSEPYNDIRHVSVKSYYLETNDGFIILRIRLKNVQLSNRLACRIKNISNENRYYVHITGTLSFLFYFIFFIVNYYRIGITPCNFHTHT